ncbi:MAG TPA: hypothetical protein VF864_08865 [Gemmatimonadales bacterium]
MRSERWQCRQATLPGTRQRPPRLQRLRLAAVGTGALRGNHDLLRHFRGRLLEQLVAVDMYSEI